MEYKKYSLTISTDGGKYSKVIFHNDSDGSMLSYKDAQILSIYINDLLKMGEGKIDKTILEQQRWFNKKSEDLSNKFKLVQKNDEGFIYIIKSGEYYKIGRAKDKDNRVKTYITENPKEIKLIFSHKVKNSKATERFLHQMFHKKKFRNEWFSLNEEDIKIIISTLKFL